MKVATQRVLGRKMEAGGDQTVPVEKVSTPLC
jgi:hypothetical protein